MALRVKSVLIQFLSFVSFLDFVVLYKHSTLFDELVNEHKLLVNAEIRHADRRWLEVVDYLDSFGPIALVHVTKGGMGSKHETAKIQEEIPNRLSFWYEKSICDYLLNGPIAGKFKRHPIQMGFIAVNDIRSGCSIQYGEYTGRSPLRNMEVAVFTRVPVTFEDIVKTGGLRNPATLRSTLNQFFFCMKYMFDRGVHPNIILPRFIGVEERKSKISVYIFNFLVATVTTSKNPQHLYLENRTPRCFHDIHVYGKIMDTVSRRALTGTERGLYENYFGMFITALSLVAMPPWRSSIIDYLWLGTKLNVAGNNSALKEIGYKESVRQQLTYLSKPEFWLKLKKYYEGANPIVWKNVVHIYDEMFEQLQWQTFRFDPIIQLCDS